MPKTYTVSSANSDGETIQVHDLTAADALKLADELAPIIPSWAVVSFYETGDTEGEKTVTREDLQIEILNTTATPTRIAALSFNDEPASFEYARHSVDCAAHSGTGPCSKDCLRRSAEADERELARSIQRHPAGSAIPVGAVRLDEIATEIEKRQDEGLDTSALVAERDAITDAWEKELLAEPTGPEKTTSYGIEYVETGAVFARQLGSSAADAERFFRRDNPEYDRPGLIRAVPGFPRDAELARSPLVEREPTLKETAASLARMAEKKTETAIAHLERAFELADRDLTAAKEGADPILIALRTSIVDSTGLALAAQRTLLAQYKAVR